MEDLKRQLAQAKKDLEVGSQSHNTSLQIPNTNRKDSHASISTANNERRNPVEDIIAQKSNQMLI